ncbi:MAG: hypothetical protein ACI39H_01570 [Lachnospiraceae bacterium]
MNKPILLENPTAFGINANGQIMAGGEAGSEVVSGINKLMNMISNAVDTNNEDIAFVLYKIQESLDKCLPPIEKQENVYIDSKKLVGATLKEYDHAFGSKLSLASRGL